MHRRFSLVRTGLRAFAVSAMLAWLSACGSAVPGPATASLEAAPVAPGSETVIAADPPPAGPLPEGVSPEHYRLALTVDPASERFSGEVWIRVRLDAPTQRVWMHGGAMTVSSVTVSRPGVEAAVPATWTTSVERPEIAALRFAQPEGPGVVELHLVFDAPFGRQLAGLYRVDVGADHYAFTQFESTSARLAFPGFDEPRWKTPFDVELTVRQDDVALANTREVESTPVEGGLRRVRFATTEPLPTYLLAMAVGPLDVIEAAPIAANAVRPNALPFRGIAARGRGPELRHALAHTPDLLAALEAYTGTAYPYDKLDIIAVPDFASGAMENAGAITFREQLLLLGDQPPEDQVRSFTGVMAHELAHQWFGNLVTMPWWDDIWLNEAFATWMTTVVLMQTHPDMHAELGALGGTHGAMGQDALEAARQVRQPIETDHDIRNAFDGITYQKGAAVLSMFEQWIGPDVFREGIRTYLRQHRFATARTEDLLGALSEVAGRDVTSPFLTFLEQPGVPLVQAELRCEAGRSEVRLAQSRFVPLGSSAVRARPWSVPVCVRYPAGREVQTSCTLLEGDTGTLALDEARGCPAWVMPNAGAHGYYRWSLSSEGLRSLLGRGWDALSPLERTSVANNLRAAFTSGAVPAADVLAAMVRPAADPTRTVLTEPMMLAGAILDEHARPEQRAASRRWAGGLYRARARSLGFAPRDGEDGETRLVRRDIMGFLAVTARDAGVRAEAVRRGRALVGADGDGALHRDAVSSDLVGVAMVAAVQEGDAAFFDAVQGHLFATEDAVLRGRLLAALASTEDPVLAGRALDLALDPRLRVNEVTVPLAVQAEHPEGRARAWAWLSTHFEGLAARVATTRGGSLPGLFSGFCDTEHREAVRAFFEPRVGALPGAPRNLRATLEAITLCEARREAQGASVQSFLSGLRP